MTTHYVCDADNDSLSHVLNLNLRTFLKFNGNNEIVDLFYRNSCCVAMKHKIHALA